MKERSPKFWDLRRPHKPFKWNPFDLHGEAPGSIRHDPIITPLVTAGLAAIYGAGTTGIMIGPIYIGASAIGSLLLGAALTGASMLLSSSSSNQKRPTAMRGGLQVNGHSAGDTLRVVYGSARTGCTWAWWKTSSSNSLNLNNLLHIVVGWCEGTCEVDKDLEQPFFKSSGLNDLVSRGPYTGGTYNKYRIQIDAEGTPDTFKWSDDDGATWEATGVAITGAWQTLNNGVQIKFKATTGHSNNDKWEMFGGDGIWIGDRLWYAFQDVSFKGATVDFAWHSFHGGALDQAIDADLASYFPEYDNPHRGTCYSYFRLKYSFEQDLPIWNSIPDFKARLKKVDIYDTRTSTSAFSRNAALVYYDFLTNGRYGRGLPTAKVLTADISAAANWCDPDKVTNGGSTYTCIGDHTSGATTEPGVGADWETFWQLTGSGGDAWVTATYYRMGFIFDGVILDKKEANEHLADIARNFLGASFESGGKTRLKVWDNDAAVRTFTELENQIVIEPEAFSIDQPSLEQVPDVVTCKFINPSKQWGWDTISYPDDATLNVARPSGNLVELQIELTGTTSSRQAKQIAKFHYNRLKYSTRFQVLAHPKLYELEPMDMITCTHEFPGWSSKKVRVDTYGVQQEGLVPCALMDENSDIYDLEVSIQSEDPNITPGIPYPELTGPDMTNVVLTVTAKKGFNLLQWSYSVGEQEENFKEWIIYRNTTNDSATSTEIDRRPRNGKQYKDHDVTDGVTYYYWLKGMNTDWISSTAFSTVASNAPLDNPVIPQTGDILFLAHFDGPTPFETDFTGNPVDSFGQAPTTLTGGVIFRPGRFGKGVQCGAATTNRSTNPSVETNLTGWSADYRCAIARVNTFSKIGSYSAEFTTASPGASFYGVIGSDSSPPQDSPYSVSVSVRPYLGHNISVILEIIEFLPVGNNTYYSAAYTPYGDGQWHDLSASFTTAADAVSLEIRVRGSADTGDGTIVNVDAVQMEAKAYPTPYCDGSLGQGHSWSGTAHASTSSRTEPDLQYSSTVDPYKGSLFLAFTPTSEDIGVGNTLVNLGAGLEFFIYFGNVANQVVCVINGVYATYVITGSSIIGSSVMLAVTWDILANSAKLYVDGVLRSTIEPTTTPWTKASTFFVGKYSTGNYVANAVIDELCMLKRVATADEVSAIFESNAPISEIISNLPDRLAPQPDPPEGMAAGTPTAQAGGSDKYKCDLSWDICVDTSGSPVKYELWIWENGTTDYKKDGAIKEVSGASTVTHTVKGLETGITYKWKVRAYDKDKNYTSFCADQTLVVGPVLTAPANLTDDTGSDETTLKVNDAYLDLGWTAVAGLQYELKYKKTANSNFKTIHINNPTAGAYIERILGLPAGVSFDWKVKAIQGSTLESAFTALQTIVTWSANPAVPDGLVDDTDPDETTDNIVDAFVECGWTRVAGLDYEFRWRKSTDTYWTYQAIKDPGAGATMLVRVGGLPVNISFVWAVQAVKDKAVSGWCANQSITTWKPTDDAAVSPPQAVTLSNKQGMFEIIITKPASTAGIKGYRIYLATAADGTKYNVSELGKWQTKANIKVGQIYTGTTTVANNTTYYFWATSFDTWDNESDYTAATPTNAKIFKAQELVHFSTPWEMTNLTDTHYQISTAGSTDVTISSGAVGLLKGYKIQGNGTEQALIRLLDSASNIFEVEYQDSTVATRRSPAYTNGLYLPGGWRFRAQIQAGGTGDAKMRVATFDKNSDITTIVTYVTNAVSYTVPAGQRFVITFLWTPYTGIYLQAKQAGSWYDVWDPSGEKWDLSKGVLQFPAGTELQSDTAATTINIVGVLVND